MKNRANWLPTKYVRNADRWSASRDPRQVAVSSRLIADILAQAYADAIERFAHGELLDHGCGQMPLFGMYSGRVENVTAVDWANSPHRVAHADTLCDLNLAMPFADESFDTVVSSDVVEHLWNPVAVFRDFARVLRPGGVLILGTPFNYWLHELPYDYFRWSPFAFAKLAEETGLELVSQSYCGGRREVLIDTLLKMAGMRFGGSLAKAVDYVARWTRFVSIADHAPGRLTLGTVSVLRRRLR